MFCLRTGEAQVFSNQQDSDAVTEEDMRKHFKEIEEADRKELQAFVTHKVFACRARVQMENGNIIDATWVRKWKWDPQLKRFVVKSRLCGRGFLDQQKHEIQRRSSTASRLNQKLIVNTSQTHPGVALESWDMSTACLQGLSFAALKREPES